MRKTNFNEKGSFYKGNLHCHSTRSDGHLEPDELVEAYKNQGYDFLAITDHNIFSDFKEFNSDDFILIPGVEANPTMPTGDYRAYHYVVFQGDQERKNQATKPQFVHGEVLDSPTVNNEEEMQNYVDDLHTRGYHVCFAHPFWSRIEYDEILYLNNLDSVEIFNFCSQISENMGESNVCCDALLRNNKKLWFLAVDDNHNIFPLSHQLNDSFGGFIVVKSEKLSVDDIAKNIAEGSFYASQGPEIKDFYVEDGEIHFKCSPCEKIYFNGDIRQIHAFVSDGKELLTEASAPLHKNQKYVRVECYDTEGKKAYTNPIWL
ncbi:Hypothetical protein ING2D1G_0217 [Peptoniphilus sp. ING2-D1G]|nr:Hypothetical protein ING2D1G_0217 [Peptoniphilus sp. ING2-D1G]